MKLRIWPQNLKSMDWPTTKAYCAVLLLLITLRVAASAQSDTSSFSEVLLLSWMPELGQLRTSDPDILQLVAVASDARDGAFDRAAVKLRPYLSSHNQRLKFLALLFEQQLTYQRVSDTSGGVQPGDINFEADISAIFDAIKYLPYDLQPQANDAATVNNLIRSCVYYAPSIIAAEASGEETFGSTSVALANLADNCDADQLLSRITTVSNEDKELLGSELKAIIARALLVDDQASRGYKHALDLALSRSNYFGAAQFALMLGDLNIARIGNPMTLGYNLDADENFKLLLEQNEWPSFFQSISPDRVNTATEFYDRAEQYLKHVSPDRWSFLIESRRAYLSALTGSSPSNALEIAATHAESQGSIRDAALLFAAHGLIGNDSSAKQKSLALLVQGHDLGGLRSVGLMSSSYAARRQFAGDTSAALVANRFGADALAKGEEHNQSANVLGSLAMQFSSFGQVDTAIELLREAVEQRRQITDDQLRNIHRKSDVTQGLTKDLAALSGLLNVKYQQEGTAYWLTLRSETNLQLAELVDVNVDMKTFYQQFLLPTQQKVDLVKRLSGNLQGRLSCSQAMMQRDFYVSAAKQYGDPVVELEVLNLFGICDAASRDEVHARLEALDPVGNIQRTLALRDRSPGIKSNGDYMESLLAFSRILNVAGIAGAYDIVDRWTIPMESLAKSHSTDARLAMTAMMVRALGLLKNPSAAAVYVHSLEGDTGKWALLSEFMRVSLMKILLEAEVRLNDPVGSFLAFAHLRSQEEVLSRDQSGLQPTNPETAELMMLRRKAAVAPASLSTFENQRLQELAGLPSIDTDNAPQMTSSDLSSLVAKLPEATTVVAFCHVQEGFVEWRLQRRASVRVKILPRAAPDLLYRAYQLRRSLVVPVPNNWQKGSSDVYADLVSPLGAIDTQNILVMLPPELREIPFEVLGQDSDHTLGHTRSLVYTSSIGNGNSGKISQSNSTLIVGLNSWGLRQAEGEAQRIAGILGAAHPLIGDSATLQAVRGALGSASIIHLATHTVLDSENPFLSYLVLQGDERLHAWELFGAAKASYMIVLSACETGHDPISAGLHPSFDLGSFVQSSTTQWLVTTLWPTDDTSSIDLMAKFYSNLQQLGPSTSLREAKRLLADQPQSHPMYYAPFILQVRSLASYINEMGQSQTAY